MHSFSRSPPRSHLPVPHSLFPAHSTRSPPPILCLLRPNSTLVAGPRRCLERMGGKEGTSLHVLATCFLVATTLGIALAVKKLGVILSVIGALCSTSVSFIVPGGAYVVVFHERGWSLLTLLSHSWPTHAPPTASTVAMADAPLTLPCAAFGPGC